VARYNRVFYAFPGEPAALRETINNAIDLLKDKPDIKRDRIRFMPWTDMDVGGKSLVNTILRNIDRSDVFACDLTYPNHNVSFPAYQVLAYDYDRMLTDGMLLDEEERFEELMERCADIQRRANNS
jgi:hypothetical protein